MGDVVALEFEATDAAPEALRPLLVKDEASGKYVAKLAPASKLNEFRENNIAKAQRVDALEAQVKAYDGLNPAEARAWKAELDRLKGGQNGNGHAAAPPSEDIQKLEARLRAAEVAMEAAKATAEEEKRLRAEEAFTNEATAAAANTKVIAKALPDFLARVRAASVLDENGRRVFKRDGVVLRRASDGEPFNVNDYAADLAFKEGVPHYYAAGANGGGAAGGANSAGGAKTMTRAAFVALPPVKQRELARAGYQLTD